MSRVFLTLLTAATMLAHGLFGCCWHHEHCHLAVEEGKRDVSAEHPEHRHVAAHRHEQVPGNDRALHDETPDAPCPSECDGERCVYVRTSDTGMFDGGAPSAIAVHEAVPSLFDMAAEPPGNRVQPRFKAPSSFSAPLHARLRVWLI